MADLQVLIAAYGEDALRQIASLPHPALPGVEYLVSWQNYGDGTISVELAERADFKIFLENSVGLSNNRNNLLEKADADFALISDADLAYSAEGLESVVRAFREHPDCDFITFKYSSDIPHKKYPPESFSLQSSPKGYFVSSVELALNLGRIKRRDSTLSHWRFNPNFGINGSLFGSGEEDILVASALRRGYQGIFLPLVVCHHPGITTSERILSTPGFIETQGAVVSFVHPRSQYLRMLSHAWKARTRGVSFSDFCRSWRRGIKLARKKDVFKNERE